MRLPRYVDKDRTKPKKVIPKIASVLSSLASLPLTLLIVGFFLTTVVGQLLSANYVEQQSKFQNNLEIQKNILLKQREYEHDDRQRQLEHIKHSNDMAVVREHSFADKINEQRINKIAETWQAVFKYDFDVDSTIVFIKREAVPTILDPSDVDQDGTGKMSEGAMKQIKAFKSFEGKLEEKLASVEQGSKAEALKMVRSNRFWLEDLLYNKMDKYINSASAYLDAEKNLSTAKANLFKAAVDYGLIKYLLSYPSKNDNHSPVSIDKLNIARKSYLSMIDAERYAKIEVDKLKKRRDVLRSGIIKTRKDIFNN